VNDIGDEWHGFVFSAKRAAASVRHPNVAFMFHLQNRRGYFTPWSL
jgi:hypothetical protein